MRILYAANNSESSNLSLKRFLKNFDYNKHSIKIAAYKKSSKNIKIDWLLDSLQNIFSPNDYGLNNENLRIYMHEIKSYNPDLIISDLEYYTSYIANFLNIRLWQCSSLLLTSGLDHKYKYKSGIFKHYLNKFNGATTLASQIKNIIHNSEKNFIYSYIGDLFEPPPIKDNFEWIRPYYESSIDSSICEHNIVGVLFNNDKSILNNIKYQKDIVLFSNFIDEIYSNIKLKNINDEQEYACNMHNSKLFFCRGEINLLADAFYNKKFTVVYPDFNDSICLLNSIFSEYFGSGKVIFDKTEDISKYIGTSVTSIDNNIKFLHQKIEEI